MTSGELIAALSLPTGCLVSQRVPKKLLLENGAPTSADRRRISEGIEQLLWVATLKPTTVGVPEYRDASREYIEINVLHLTTRSSAKSARLIELIHRAVPYPLLLVTEGAAGVSISVAHKRWSQNEAGKTVLEDEVVNIEWDEARDFEHADALQAALALGRQPRTTMYALYQGWLDTIVALQAARVSGTFSLPANAEDADARRRALRDISRLQDELARLRSAAEKTTQVARQVEINFQVKRAESAEAIARSSL